MTAYAAGISEVRTAQFALFAYGGGFLWVTAFLIFRILPGRPVANGRGEIHHYAVIATIIGAMAAGGYFVWWKLRRKR